MVDIPHFGDHYIELYDTQRKRLEVRRKSQREGNLSLGEAMELMGNCLQNYQMTYRINREDPSTFLFPFLLRRPPEGTQIINTATREVYTVDQIIENPETGTWDGVVRLQLRNAPTGRQKLKFVDKHQYVRFDHEFSMDTPNLRGANNDRTAIDAGPIVPIISWTLLRREPGGSNQPFGPKKEYKPRLRESVKDPYEQGYTVEIVGQWFDNIIQFDCWEADNRSAEQLVEWFEQFMRLYSWIFMKEGLNQIFFWQRNRDTTETKWRQDIVKRSTQFYLRTEQLEAYYQKDLLKVDITVGSTTDNIIVGDQNIRWIADQRVSGQLTGQAYRNLFYRSGVYLFGDLDIRY